MKRVALFAALVVAITACAHDTPPATTVHLDDPGRCTPVDVAAAPEIAGLLGDLAHSFNASSAARLRAGTPACAFVRVQPVESSAAVQYFLDGWPRPDQHGPPPALWAPSSSAWLTLVNGRLRNAGRPALVAGGTSLGHTGVVVAMPSPMATALGWPGRRIGWRDFARLAANPRGWAAYGHPEWGAFRLGKAKPTHASDALLSTIALSRLTDASTAIALESSVVYYGDASWRFLDNWFRLDQKHLPLSYVSAVVTDQRAVTAYNAGSANGLIPDNKHLKRPHTPLAAVVPSDGTFDADNPLVVPDGSWVRPDARAGAAAFVAYTRSAEAQKKIVAAGLHPGGAIDPVSPDLRGTAAALDAWARIRKRARVLLLFDVSDSMGDNSDPKDPKSPTKIALAKHALLAGLSELGPDDEVGLRVFTTDIRKAGSPSWADVVPIGRFDRQRRGLMRAVAALAPGKGSPLYAAARGSYDTLARHYDRKRINAVVLLTDGYNEDEHDNNRQALLAHLREPIRMFTIAYSPDADLSTLRRIAQATNAQCFDATDPTGIDDAFEGALASV
ncbi:MAG TPA: substrate-binding domain-containing protein [Acidimicrobiia bacterium]|nr:substrate-binding domain-containing protein [Acidimicrobiia bacterium]